MLYIIVGLLALVMVGTGGGYLKGRSDGVSIYEAKVAEQQKQLQDAADKIKQEEQTHEQEMQAAYAKGQAEAKTITRKIYVKGQSDVTKYPVFSNPACVLPDDLVRFVNGARARQYVASDSAGTPGAVPNPAAPGGRQDGNDVPANAGGLGARVGVHQPTGATGSSGQVPGTGSGKPPKPKVVN